MVKTPSLLDLIKLVPAAELTRAANALGVGPDALKKRILESFMGSSLVETAAKALKPGEAGRLVIDHASRIFSQARDLTRDLEELAGLQAPELHFGTDMFAAELPLGAALGRMASVNSRLRVRTVSADFEHLAREVLATKLEFAIADTTSAERHPTKLAIEPVAEHRLFFFVRQGHPLTASKTHSLETILVFPLVAPRLPQRIGSHITQSVPQARIDRETGDHLPNLMLDSFAVARNLVLRGRRHRPRTTRCARGRRTSRQARIDSVQRTLAASELRVVLSAQALAVACRAAVHDAATPGRSDDPGPGATRPVAARGS